MDGVAGLTQEPVKPGGTFEYDFIVLDAGTYWYHAHNKSWNQVAWGLYGALIVEDEEPALDKDHDLTLMIGA
jgi:FtsP/CotA-like multicopper oxidase with cupredoxin domain